MMKYNLTVADKASGAATVQAVELLAGAEIGKGVSLAIRHASSVAAEVHAIAMQGLMHAAEHGNPVFLNRLFKGLHDSQRPLAIKRWAMKYGPVDLSKNKAGDEVLRVIPKTMKSGEANPAWREFDIQGAADNPYWKFKGDVRTTEFTLAQLLKFVADKIKAGEKAIEDDKFDGNIVRFVAAKHDLLAVVDKYAGDKGIAAAETTVKVITKTIAAPEPVAEETQQQPELAVG